MLIHWPGMPRRPKIHVFEVYPDLRPVGDALRAGDWPQVVAGLDGLPAGTDLADVIHAVVDVKGTETFLRRMVDEQESSLPQVLLAARYITIGWQIRTGRRARSVSSEQFAAFHMYLRRAERLLGEVTGAEPDNTTAWALRLAPARGLRFGLTEARRRYARAAQGNPTPTYAQRQLLQQLCPKWGGSFADVDAFATACLRDAPGGSLGGALVARAHLERLLELPWTDFVEHLRQPHVAEQLRQAAAHSVLHPDHRPVFGWVAAHNTFAYLWHQSGEFREAARHFQVIGDRMGTEPWEMVPGFPEVFDRVRHVSLERGR